MVMAKPEGQAGSICGYSTRISLRWPPDPPQETTDTIVISVNGWYMDLRMDKNTGKIDWAIAGKRVVESQEPLRVSFTHALDSHNAFEGIDCGTFVSLANGDKLETGSMPRYDLPGMPMARYEEIWRELPFKEGPEGPNKGMSWILESENEELEAREGDVTVTKTFLGRVWGTYLALQQKQTRTYRTTPVGNWSVRTTGTVVSARREEWNSGWTELYVAGPEGDTIPSLMKGFEGEAQARGSWEVLGLKVVIAGQVYVVRACERIR